MPETKCGFNDAPGVSGSSLLVAHGPTVFVDIGFDATYQPGPKSKPVPSITGVWALVDTGAMESCIDSLLAASLNLPIIDRRTISRVSGPKEVNVHLAQIHVPALVFTQYGAFAAVDVAAGGQRHLALIGRTFLQHFKMVYEGATGTVTLSSV
jgi:hypothetical protein